MATRDERLAAGWIVARALAAANQELVAARARGRRLASGDDHRLSGIGGYGAAVSLSRLELPRATDAPK